VTGVLVVLEGADGSGKSTQATLLVERLRAKGCDVVQTFEPGATPVGAAIRGIVLGTPSVLDARAEALLIAADRAQHVAEVVAPALQRGAVVVSDRFVPSSLAYQGRARGLGVEHIEALNEWAAGGVVPDVVVVLDIGPEELDARRPRPSDRLEREGAGFQDAVRAAYVELAADRGWLVVDGRGAVDEVAARVWDAVAAVVVRTRQ
jgi:dTMP kinase